MKNKLMTILRDRNSSREAYRQAAEQLSLLLAIESSSFLVPTTKPVETPLAQTEGVEFKQKIILVPILRSGLVLLDPFLRFYPNASVGFIGTRRDEITAIPELYYENLPPIDPSCAIFLLDPMLATGGSASLAVKILKKAKALESQIFLISFIAATEGISTFKKNCKEAHLLVAQIDQKLDAQKWILPGLGDFGDRYFGTDA